jgi:bifunctional DNase/RNase
MKRLLIAAIVACGAPPPPPKPPAPPPAPAEPSEPTGRPAGYVEMHAWKDIALGQQAALLLVDDPPQVVLPIFIGGTEGASILGRMHGDPPPRPLTHDLLEHVLKELHGTLVQVQVDELRPSEGGGVFVGSIFVRDGRSKRVIRLDARPSDAIALALGARCPIYVAKRVLDEAGQPYVDIQRQLNTNLPET